MNKKRIAFCLLVAVPMALLIILCAEATNDFETNEGKGTMTSPLFVSSMDRFIKSDAKEIQTNYIGRSGGPLKLSLIKSLGLRNEEVIAFYNGDIIGGLGPSFLRLEWEAAIRITPQELEPYEGWEIIGARCYHWENWTNEGSLKIYDEGNSTSPGDLIGSEPYNVSGKGWRRINLTTPVPLDITHDIWTSFLIIKHGAADYPMGIDSGPAVDGKGDWAKLGPDYWGELQWYGLENNWGIETIINFPPLLKAYAFGPYGGLVGEDLQFRGGASGGSPPYTWHWDFGDGNTSTQRYPSHAYQEFGNYTIALTVTDSNASTANATTWALISHAPPTNPNITGPIYGRPGVEYTFCIEGITDPEGDAMYALWDWGDGNFSGWIGPFNSGETFCASHAWELEGTYLIRVKCKDIYGTESAWSDPFIIIIEAGEPHLKITKPQRAIYLHNQRILPRFFRMSLIIGDIDIIVNASDNVSGIERVEFYIDRELKANITTPPFSFMWTKDTERLLFHIHIIKAVAYDNAGNSGDSEIFVRRFF